MKLRMLIIALLVGICLPAIGGYLFLLFGGLPVATSSAPLPLEKFVAKTALHAAMKDEEDKPSPIKGDEPNLLAGAKIYSTNCAVCHGLPNNAPTVIAKGLFPKPPQLFDPDKGVTDDPVGETFWKVKNGIRLTGMPGFTSSLTENEMWQVSELLLNADKIPTSVQSALLIKSQ